MSTALSYLLTKDIGVFRCAFTEKDRFLEFRRRTFGPERSWRDAAHVSFTEICFPCFRLSSGRDLSPAHLRVYISVYPVGISTMVFWLSLGEQEFHEQELIELTALARGTDERIDPSTPASLVVDWPLGRKLFSSLFEVSEYIREEFCANYSLDENRKRSAFQFVYPLLYVGEVLGCESAEEICKLHGKSVAGLLDLWIHDSQWLKDEEITRALQTDLHPFTYGATFVSSSSTIELHPSNIRIIAELEGQSLKDHHFQEMAYLAVLCEMPVAQMFALRIYEKELLKIVEELPLSGTAMWSPLFIPRLLYHAILLSSIRRHVTRSVNQFRDVRIMRKSYAKRVLELYQEAFSISQLMESIDNKD